MPSDAVEQAAAETWPLVNPDDPWTSSANGWSKNKHRELVAACLRAGMPLRAETKAPAPAQPDDLARRLAAALSGLFESVKDQLEFEGRQNSWSSNSPMGRAQVILAKARAAGLLDDGEG